MTIFRSARLTLTAWYLLIIMLVSLSFSAVIYAMLNREVERFSRIQRTQIERRLRSNESIPRNFPPGGTSIILMDPDLIRETSRRILLMLAAINGTIFILAGGLGYVLAGRTLQPIADMVDEQNRFIQDSSHELRTPLTSLKSALEVNLRDKHLNLEDAKTVMRENVIEVNKLQSLSDSLLALAQYQKPKGNLPHEMVSLTQVMLQAVHTIQPQASVKKITVVNQVKNYTIKGSKESLAELFVILLDNAIKYSPSKSSIYIRTKKIDHAIDISIRDEGIGITPENLEHIFDRFYRADNARSSNNASGYGLGLSIARTIAANHNGTIKVVSEVKKGSTFTVRMPIIFS